MSTGHRKTRVDGISIADVIEPTMRQEALQNGIKYPTSQQVGLVMSALRMHTIIMHASDYDRSELGKPNQETSFYPTESSIGRWLRDAGRELMEDKL